MDRRTLDLAGALLMTGVPGTSLDAATRKALEQMRPGGIILFKRNVADPEQLRALVADLHALAWRPLVAIDHEGGPVMRVSAPFTLFPAARAVARSESFAYDVGHAMGAELAAVDVDIDLAPVLDVDSNPRNPVIGERSFGSTPEEVIRHALPFAHGLRDAGIIPCGKHFPGHGDTDRDSHHELPIVRRSRGELEAVELAPFRAAIAAGLPMIMTAHVLYPGLDPNWPATMSRRILVDLLRGDLGFRGVIVSDDLEMRGISASRPVAEVAVDCLRAGVDWLLVCNDFALSVQTAQAVAAAIESGALERARLEKSAARIAALRAYPAAKSPVPLPCANHVALNEKIRAARAKSECPAQDSKPATAEPLGPRSLRST